MLLRDNKPYEMTSSDEKMVMDEIGKFPCVIRFPKSAYTAHRTYDTEKTRKSKDRVVRRDRPIIHPIPLKSEVMGPNGSELWMWSRLPVSINEKTGQPRLTTTYLELDSEMTLQKRDMELVFFLLFKSSVREGGPNTRTSRPLFYFENKEKEIVSIAALRKVKSKVESLIWDKMHIDHLRVMAQAYGIGGSNLMGENELKHTLATKVEVQGIKGYEDFLQKATPDKSGEEISRRTQRLAMIQEAKDLKIIGTDKTNQKWYFLNEEGKNESVICELMAGMSIETTLMFKIESDTDLYERLKEAVDLKKMEIEEALTENK